MTDRLTDKTIFVTGAASGIGRAIATRFVAEGARVAFADRDWAGAQHAAAAAGAAAGAGDRAASTAGTAEPIHVDITDESSVEAAFARVDELGWTLDVVVANAGVQLFGRDAKAADLDLDVWRATLDVNLTGTFLTVKHAVRALTRPAGSRGGSVILTGSPTGLNGEGQDFTAYSTTKAGIHGLARTVAAAYAADNVRVNTVVPGYTETPLVTSISGDDESRAAIVSRTPLGRAGTPSDVEGIMVYLASDESAFATGALFRVDGGMTSL